MDYPLRLADQLKAHLRGLRKQRGLTQAQLGQHLGIAQSRVAEIESKPGLVSVAQLIKVLAVLDATLLLRGPDDPAAPEEVAARRTRSAARRSGKAATSAASRTSSSGTKKRSVGSPAVTLPPKKGSW